MKHVIVIIMGLFILSSCYTVTMVKESESLKIVSQAQYQRSQMFFLWGLLPEIKNIDLKHICGNRKVLQMQTLETLSDQIIQIITLGIIYPRTAKVWCSNLQKPLI